jgi:hypothetical protein
MWTRVSISVPRIRGANHNRAESSGIDSGTVGRVLSLMLMGHLPAGCHPPRVPARSTPTVGTRACRRKGPETCILPAADPNSASAEGLTDGEGHDE